MQQLDFYVSGVDQSPKAISLAKRRGLRKVALGSIEKLPFRASTFEGVYCTDVLGMLDKRGQQKAVGEFHRVLKKGGVVVVQCAALEKLRSSHDEVVRIVKRFSMSELEQLFPLGQWQLEIHSYRYCWIFPVIALIKYMKRQTVADQTKSDVFAIPWWLNTIFLWVQLGEDFLISRFRFRMPIGSSVVVVAKKL